ncbi:MAG TPA: hypothetical protein VMA83_11775 [Solirubrobacteraceae bacterium]|nr:hypothetical protein [Solirubrobacteraceae bacterium]
MATASSAARARSRRRSSHGGVRWDRVGRAVFLCVLVGLAVLYASAALSTFDAWRQSRGVDATLARLEREHARLRREHSTLEARSTIEAEALRMGMTHRGEQQYMVTGLPSN